MTPKNEALRGELLAAWLDDLRQDRPPRDHPAVRALSPDDVAEVLRLARWHKSVFFPSLPAAALAAQSCATPGTVRAALGEPQVPAPADELLPEVTDMDHFTSLVTTTGVFMRPVRLGTAAPIWRWCEVGGNGHTAS